MKAIKMRINQSKVIYRMYNRNSDVSDKDYVISLLNSTAQPSINRLLPPPANIYDFPEKGPLHVKWTAFLEKATKSSIWETKLENENDQSETSALGIAYRLPEYVELAKSFDKIELKQENYLQYRSAFDIQKIAEVFKKDVKYAPITWTGFPRSIKNNPNVNPYDEVEKLGYGSVTYIPNARKMDEYCEWFTHSHIDNNGKKVITKIDITAEGPEYYNFLYTNDKEILLNLYRKYVSPDVQLTDLNTVQKGEIVYDPYNKWNTTKGIMHLNCPPNSLTAEIYIAAEASTYWSLPVKEYSPYKLDNLKEFATTAEDLIRSGRYGLKTRASDPHIGSTVNSLIRGNLIVSLKRPVGLYLENLDTAGWSDPNGKPFTPEQISQIVTYQRFGLPVKEYGGNRQMNVRISVSIPTEWGYNLSDCFIGSDPIDSAGKLIDYSARVYLYGVAVDGTGFIKNDARTRAIVPSKKLWKFPKYPKISPVDLNTA